MSSWTPRNRQCRRLSVLLSLVLLLLSHQALVAALPLPPSFAACPNYEHQSKIRHDGNRSQGKYKLPMQRPEPACRTFNSTEVESAIERMRGRIKDPDLFRLFENAYPNTLDTMIKWTGFAQDKDSGKDTDEDLAFVITGDINAMWLRDSANQILSYASVLQASNKPDSLAALFRGTINAHSRYIKISPYCHAFQPFEESGIPPSLNGAYHVNTLNKPYDPKRTFDCKWELDSLASFLQISSAYYNATSDLLPFEKYTWLETILVILDAVKNMRMATYDEDGNVIPPGYTMVGQTNRATETNSNDGHGNPVTNFTGLVRSTFRPSDDATIFQFLIPSNMALAVNMERTSHLLTVLEKASPKLFEDNQSYSKLNEQVTELAKSLRKGIQEYAIHFHRALGPIYAFEIDGYGSVNLMDDANLPSLLSCTFIGFCSPEDPVYQNTRRFALGKTNPYWAWSKKDKTDAKAIVPRSTTDDLQKKSLATALLAAEDEAGDKKSMRRPKRLVKRDDSASVDEDVINDDTMEDDLLDTDLIEDKDDSPSDTQPKQAESSKKEDAKSERKPPDSMPPPQAPPSILSNPQPIMPPPASPPPLAIPPEYRPYDAPPSFLNAIGGPHIGTTKGWPLAAIMRVMTALNAPSSGSRAIEDEPPPGFDLARSRSSGNITQDPFGFKNRLDSAAQDNVPSSRGKTQQVLTSDEEDRRVNSTATKRDASPPGVSDSQSPTTHFSDYHSNRRPPSFDLQSEVYTEIASILSTTDGLGLVHESVNAHRTRQWTRHWFGWANGMLGEMILAMEEGIGVEYGWQGWLGKVDFQD